MSTTMLWSEFGIQTIREENHPLLVRAGYRRAGPASQAEWLPLGLRALSKINRLMEECSDFGNVLRRCEVQFVKAGGVYFVETETGQDVLVEGDGYAALLDQAVARPQAPSVADPLEEHTPEIFETPGVKTIAQIAAFSGLPATSQIKSLVMMADGALILVLLRGDHQMSAGKFASVTGASQIRQATAEEIQAAFRAEAGSLGPVGIAGVRVIADEALRGRRDMIAGANRTDHHIRHVTPGKDFQCEFADLRLAMEGDTSLVEGGPLRFIKVMRITSASDILEASAAQNFDADGLAFSAAIAPFDLVITPVHPDHLAAAHKVAGALPAFEILVDDRDARPGVKFKDADLLGIPYRINLGKKLAEGKVEIVTRRPKKSEDTAIDQVAEYFSTPR